MTDELKPIMQLIDDMQDNHIIEAAILAHVQAAIDAALESVAEWLDTHQTTMDQSVYDWTVEFIRSRIGANPLAERAQGFAGFCAAPRHKEAAPNEVSINVERIVMFCCGKERDGKFCSECGAEFIADTTKRNLADYLDRQAKTVKKNIDNRLKIYPDIEESTVKKWNQKVKKWEEWRDWVLSVDSET